MDSQTPQRRQDHRRIENEAAAWLARRSDGGQAWTSDDQSALDVWLDAATAHQVAFLRLEMVWQRGDRLKAVAAGLSPGEVPAKGEWRRAALLWPEPTPLARHQEAAEAQGNMENAAFKGDALSQLRFRPRAAYRRRGVGLIPAGLAAACLCAVLAGVVWMQYHNASDPIHVATVRGQTGDFPLADGSRADLSAETRLDISFSRRTRDITLQQGEAYFEVAKDARRPFSVRVGDASVTALGTRFAVRGEAGVVRVVVTEGTVRLDTGTSATRMPSAVLQAGAVATVTHGVVRVESRSVEQARQLLGWRNGELLFRSTPLNEAIAEFNRFNTLQLQIKDPSLADLRIDGGFRADNSEGFVRLLEQMFPLQAVKHANRIDLYQRQ